MPSWKKPHAAPQQIDLLLFDQFSGHCLANTVEPLRAANTLAGRQVYSWRFVTVDGGTAMSSARMEVTAQMPLHKAEGDMLIAMPSYGYLRHTTEATARGLRAAQQRYGVLAGFDTGAWLLAAAGLLDGYRATIHSSEMEAFADMFPAVQAETHRFLWDRNRLTSSGAMAAFDGVLDMIAQQHGQALRLDVAALFLSESQSGSDRSSPVRSTSVARAIRAMEANLETPLPLEEVARHAGRSLRDLARRTRGELGTTPQALYRHLRLKQAKRLVLETDFSVAEIAVRCGYEDPSALTRAFRSAFATTPRALRATRR
ncbi:GlxA family transcriptional regulator [Phaeobacter inhibens]|uniref:GlxA family transcriptional regulator n=1 Tax=Phaeobacter inhibens TaxID=221822 RepID=UPI0021A4C9EB|nr:helix-turn-helix domain-containing protein [Phaeobacter inhibens]UWS07900.1 helix-turn-helix domain-containing protein [Phaeobacter inhibens]